MKKFPLLLFVFIIKVLSSSKVNANQVSCETRIIIEDDDSDLQDRNTCFLNEETRITSAGSTIAQTRNQIKKILFSNNKNIFFLPTQLGENFQNLESFLAHFCSIKTISRSNFANLRRLSVLGLSGNQIEIIPSNTFKDLVSLRILNLSLNKIKNVNGIAFSGLNSLTSVVLNGNVCIKKNFDSAASIARLVQEIDSKCSFLEGATADDSEISTGTGNSNNVECGQVKVLKGLIKNGTEVKHGQWPFVAALYHLVEKKFFCGGVLISSRHVITAAHCIQYKYEIGGRTASDIAVLLGRHDVEAKTEIGAVSKAVRKIHIHPDWQIHSSNWDADIVLLVIDEVEFTDRIQPVCVPYDTAVDDYDDGTVVGWGLSENTQSTRNILRQVTIRAVIDASCISIAKLGLEGSPSGRTFCAGGQRSGPCNGDSGGGFFVKIGSSWMLKGIVSSSLLDEADQCDVGKFSLFTKVVRFNDWIDNLLRTT